jgi:hypothetical protein
MIKKLFDQNYLDVTIPTVQSAAFGTLSGLFIANGMYIVGGLIGVGSLVFGGIAVQNAIKHKKETPRSPDPS